MGWRTSQKKRKAATASRRQTVATCAAELKPQKQARVWNGRFFLGKLGIFVGEPGVGKGQIATFMAAKVSTGGDWPHGEGSARRGDVIYITAEDKDVDTIRPRLEAAGADLKRVHIVEGVNDHFGRRPFNLVTDLGYLSAFVRAA
jgi:putative DNA primase/helicase